MTDTPRTVDREWVQVKGWGMRGEQGWIPRDVLEGIGVNCLPLDSRDACGRQGTVWFTAEQSQAIRLHAEWESKP